MAAFAHACFLRGMFSSSIFPSTRTIWWSFRPKVWALDNRMINLPSLKTHNLQAPVWKIGTHRMMCSSRQPFGVRSIYLFNSASHLIRKMEKCLKSSSNITFARNINTNSKLGKRKTCKAVAARFIRTGKGKLKRWRVGKNHKMMHKGPKRSMRLRKPTYVNKQQLKLLNKMLNGW